MAEQPNWKEKIRQLGIKIRTLKAKHELESAYLDILVDQMQNMINLQDKQEREAKKGEVTSDAS